MISCTRSRSSRGLVRFLRAAAILAAVGVGMMVFADSAVAQGAPESHNATRFGGPTRFTPPMRNMAALQKTFAQPRMQADVRKAFAEAGIEGVTDMFLKAIADGNVKEVSVPVGTRWEWMTSRSASTRRPHVMHNVTWAGKKPVDAYEIVLDDMNKTYTFWIPKVCGNVGITVSEPSREKTRLDAIAAEKARVEAEQKAREAAAEKARQEALAKQKAEEERIAREKAAAAAAAAAAEKARLEAEQRAREAAAAAAAEADRLEKMNFFVAGFVGKERRIRETGMTATTPAVAMLEALCSPLFGVKAGPVFRPNKARTLEIAPAVGVAVNTRKASYSSLFAELELNGRFNDKKTYLGTGIGLWDITHSDFRTPTLLVNFGQQVWQGQTTQRAFFTVEARSFLKTKEGGLASNYQFWAGLRYLWR